jgi:hypothetical protein
MKYLIIATVLVLTTTALVADYLPKPKELQPMAQVLLKTLNI